MQVVVLAFVVSGIDTMDAYRIDDGERAVDINEGVVACFCSRYLDLVFTTGTFLGGSALDDGLDCQCCLGFLTVSETLEGQFELWVLLTDIAGVGLGCDGELGWLHRQCAVDKLESRSSDLACAWDDVVGSNGHVGLYVWLTCLFVNNFFVCAFSLAIDRCSSDGVGVFVQGAAILTACITSGDRRYAGELGHGALAPFLMVLVSLDKVCGNENGAVAWQIFIALYNTIGRQQRDVLQCRTTVEGKVADAAHLLRNIKRHKRRGVVECFLWQTGKRCEVAELIERVDCQRIAE